jgi:sugar lactone lactonase YvrE
MKLKGFLLAICIILLLPVFGTAQVKVGYDGELLIGKPYFVAVDHEGKIYTSQKNGTITIMDAKGKVLSILGGKDKKWKNILKGPRGIAFYKDKLYVADAGLGAVVVLKKDGTLLEKFGSKGTKPKQFNDPQGLYVYDGVIYVADKGNNRIQVLGANGVYLGQIGSRGSGDAILNKPHDVKVDPRGFVYTVDTKEKKVKVYKLNGKFVKTLKIPGLENPNAIALDKDGIIISDVARFKVVKVNYKYEHVVSFGTKGKGRAQFESMGGIAVNDEGKVYVADSVMSRLQVFHPERSGDIEELKVVPPPTSVTYLGETSFPLSKIIWDGTDTLYGIDPKKKMIVQIKDGKKVKEIALPKVTPVSIALDPQRNLWVLDGSKKRIIKLKPDFTEEYSFGAAGKREGYFNNPSDLIITSTGTVYIADKGNKRIQIFSSDGVFIRVIGAAPKGAKPEEQGFVMSPVAMAIDSEDMLFVLDDKKSSVIVYDAEGKYSHEFGGKRKDNNKPIFMKPMDLAVSDDEIFILDAGKNIVLVFNKKGKRLRSFGSPGKPKDKGRGEFVKPASIALKNSIEFFISDLGSSRIQRFVNIYTPTKPKGVVARGGTRNVMINWDENPQSFVSKYVVYRSIGDTGIFMPETEVSSSNYIDHDVEPGVTYLYRIAAVADQGNESRVSEIVSAEPTKYVAAKPKGLIVEPQEWSSKLVWDKNGEDYIDHYVIYMNVKGTFKEVGQVQDSSEFFVGGLDPVTEYTFAVSSVSTDDVESQMSMIETKTLVATRPPLEVDVIVLKDVFSNSYKIYEKEGIGQIKVINNTMSNISRLKVSFSIKDFMDFASEVEIKDLAPRGSQDVDLKAVLNNRILEVSEDTPVQTEITLSYYANGELKEYTNNYTINVFEKHKMKWNTRERMASFVTTKDPVLIEFTRKIITQYGETSEPMLYASALYDALGLMGLTYVQDPASSYQEISGNTETVDYLQYPRETLKHKSGDCDDLVILFASAMESIGIRTKVLDVPGHMFMMFEVGKVDDLGTDTMDDLFVVYEDAVWIPIEMTKVGSTFLEAWEVGSKTYYDWVQKSLGVMDLRDAWGRFKPANLPATDFRADPIERVDIEEKFNDEFKELRKIRVKIRSKKYIKALAENPLDALAFMQLGIVYAESGETGEAMKAFEKAKQIDPENAAILNNIGNVYFIDDLYSKAAKAYEQATLLDPEDAYIWVNLTRSYIRLDMDEKARKTFAEAYKLDPAVSKRFRGMALKLLGPI